jgi:hypothetical protein
MHQVLDPRYRFCFCNPLSAERQFINKAEDKVNENMDSGCLTRSARRGSHRCGFGQNPQLSLGARGEHD